MSVIPLDTNDGPKSDEEEEYRHIFRNMPGMDETTFCNNEVTTAVYTVWNFLPKFLFYSFSKLANFFFLVVSILQCIPEISNTESVPTTLPPLIIIIVIEGIMQILEDRERWRADKEANSHACQILRNVDTAVAFADATWIDIRVADIIRLSTKEPVPADVLVLAVSESDPLKPTGACYVETKSLDGETSLKGKSALLATMHAITGVEDLQHFAGQVQCEMPNKYINKFTGKLIPKHCPNKLAAPIAGESKGDLTTTPAQEEPITLKNVIFRGSTIQTTKWVYGLVLNTGNDTKVMQSMRRPPLKVSSVDKETNRLILFCCLVLVIMCFTASFLNISWAKENQTSAYYLQLEPPSLLTTVQIWFRYFLVSSQFISVSLYVCMNMAKFAQAWFMQNSLEMYHEASDTPMKVRTMNLNEELGIITHIFSDKTGTLTENIMEFRKCSIGGHSYGTGTTEIGLARLRRLGKELPKANEKPISGESVHTANVNFCCPEFLALLSGRIQNGVLGHEEADYYRARNFALHLSLCHTVVFENGELSASSPDEQALVAAASHFGFQFKDCVQGIKRVYDKKNQSMLSFKVHEIFEFSSERKRMSLIVQDMQTGQIRLLAKGADNVMWDRIAGQKKLKAITAAQMVSFSEDGLRTLAIAWKELTPEEHKAFAANFKKAISDLVQVDLKKAGKPNQIDTLIDTMEQQLELLGCTALEDKLQAGVPRTITDMRRAGVSTWMLTGDKEETAINIAFACELLDNRTNITILNHKKFLSKQQLAEELTRKCCDAQSAFSSGEVAPYALVIDGDVLECVLARGDKGQPIGCQGSFLRFAHFCKAVVACRCAPAQKAEIVQLIREAVHGARTLSIGDGANDVAMIQAAHVGVGISGQEGLQAVNNSDFAIAQFRFLRGLILVHGRNNYRRMSTLVCYMFYKNILMVLTQYWFTFYTGISGQKFSPEFGVQMFNFIWTLFPIMFLAVFDQDVSHGFSTKYPQLFHLGVKKVYFSRSVCLLWFIEAVYESLGITFITLSTLRSTMHSGEDAGLWLTGAHTFTMVVFVVHFKLALFVFKWTYSFSMAWAFGPIIWWPCCYIGQSKGVSLATFLSAFAKGWLGLWDKLQVLPVFWFSLVLVSTVVLLPQFAYTFFKRQFYPEFRDLVIEVEQLGLDEHSLEWEIPEKQKCCTSIRTKWQQQANTCT